MPDENVEDSPDECEREESKMAAGWWVYKAPVGKGLIRDYLNVLKNYLGTDPRNS